MKPAPHSPARRSLRILAGFAAVCALLCPCAESALGALRQDARGADDKPAKVKTTDPRSVRSAALYNLAAYVKWPERTFKTKDEPLRVAVFGADPFDGTLETLLKGKKMEAHPLRVLRFATLEDVGECEILYVPEKEEPQLPKLLEKCKDRVRIVVGESHAMAAAGAGIGLYFEESKLRISVNLEPLRAAGIEPSSELLKLARVIGIKKEGQGK